MGTTTDAAALIEWLRKPYRSSLLRGRAPLHRLLDGSNEALGAVGRVVAMPG